MRFAIYAVAVVGVIAAFLAGFALLDLWNRAKRKRVRSIASLSRRALSREAEFTTTLQPAVVLDRLAAAFADRAPSTPHRTDREMVMFWGSGGGMAQFRGIASMRAENIPIRLAAEIRDGTLRVMIDEDFGFHLFVGPAREIFKDLYKDALDQAVERVQKQFHGT